MKHFHRVFAQIRFYSSVIPRIQQASLTTTSVDALTDGASSISYFHSNRGVKLMQQMLKRYQAVRGLEPSIFQTPTAFDTAQRQSGNVTVFRLSLNSREQFGSLSNRTEKLTLRMSISSQFDDNHLFLQKFSFLELKRIQKFDNVSQVE